MRVTTDGIVVLTIQPGNTTVSLDKVIEHYIGKGEKGNRIPVVAELPKDAKDAFITGWLEVNPASQNLENTKWFQSYEDAFSSMKQENERT